MPRRSSLLWTLLLLVPVLVRGAADPVVKSAWKSHDIAIDGSGEDWTGLTTVESGLSIGAANDADSLFLVVSSDDLVVRRALARGLVVWFDETGKKRTDFGVEWPETLRPGTGLDGALPPGKLEDLDVLGPGKIRRLVSLTPALGVEAASGTAGDTLVFELKVPLVSSAAHTYAVGAPAGRMIQMGVFLPDDPVSAKRGEREPPPDPRTFGLGPLIGGPSSGVPLPDSSQKAPKPGRPLVLKDWIGVQLAARP